ncbi:hypothetical protein H6F44_06235 [Pseudanabaena sp. FACHB-1277]|uniref:DUF1579 domain-containing protein n=1 Tax=Pseudanabaena cinerea FACHB-1277 TaxID=2949581 RepID=A0A926UR54_9CYAN|nr:hypothetical protein [Pseudanabaena cinerea]MBD2149724.1 hypothetical protein [Pseudanabaena cinerea FACHB-1277]
MSHTFLVQPGKWSLEGNWIERDAMPIGIKGKTLVGWSKDNFWFTMVTKLTFPNSDRPEITMAYKGRIDSDDRRFTFVVEHSDLGKIEGEGIIGPDSITQRYWVMGDKKMRTGFQTLYRRDQNVYSLASAIVSGQNLESTMEAILTRHMD